jgi:hypothetical protein
MLNLRFVDCCGRHRNCLWAIERPDERMPMPPLTRFTSVLWATLVLLVTLPIVADTQGRAVPRHPPHPQPAVVVRGNVFVGGYFYDPMFGPYPWWPRAVYPYRYLPVYDMRGDVHLRVKPEQAEDAAVYVDGFYAGVVDDFNGVFQSLPLTPGGHTVVLYLQGYRTVRHNFYLSPGSRFTLRATMDPLPSGETSETPDIAPPVPTPPPGTYRTPVTPARTLPPRHVAPTLEAVGFGTLDLFVRPAGAEVTIDGEQWVTSDEGHFIVQVPAGTHHVEVNKSGFRHFVTNLEIRDGQTVPLNVSLLTR